MSHMKPMPMNITGFFDEKGVTGYDNVHSTVDSLAESFEELVKNKVNFVDFDDYPDKIVVREDLTEEELSAVDDLVCDLKDCVDVSDVDDNKEMSLFYFFVLLFCIS